MGRLTLFSRRRAAVLAEARLAEAIRMAGAELEWAMSHTTMHYLVKVKLGGRVELRTYDAMCWEYEDFLEDTVEDLLGTVKKMQQYTESHA